MLKRIGPITLGVVGYGLEWLLCGFDLLHDALYDLLCAIETYCVMQDELLSEADLMSILDD